MKTENILAGFLIMVLATRFVQKKSLTDTKFILGMVGTAFGLAAINDVRPDLAVLFATLIYAAFLFSADTTKLFQAVSGTKK